ncbi:MAG: hypothetical protein Q9160_007330 [Pyrenula sp. 1 TL-2023]
MENGTATSAPSTAPDGVVVPPKDIRAIVEKTAGYVARNGPVFEDRIRDKEQHNPKFSFLSPEDAYAPFYQWRLSEVRAGRGSDLSAGRTGPTAPVEDTRPKGPQPPAEFYFSARMPNISAKDLEIVRLTALHVARKGKSWMTALSQREARNPQFDFLRPQHSLNNLFTRTVEQYQILLQTGPEGEKAERIRTKELEKNLQDKFHILERAKKRAEFVKYQEAQKQAKAEEDQAEQLAYAQIDWHDFVVVETVVFTDADDQVDLPPPTSLNDLQSASLEQKAQNSLARADMRIEEAMPTDDMTSYYNPYTQQPQAEPYAPQQPSYTPQYPQPMDTQTSPPPPPSISPAPPFTAPTAINASTLPPRPNSTTQPQASSNAPMRIRTDYIPRAARTTARQTTTLCPNCAQPIPLSEFESHMRIELLDPRWKEQKAKSDSRYSTTNLSTVDVANNLKRLASQRSDVFDPLVGELVGKVLEEDEETRRKRVQLDFEGGVGVGVGKEPVVAKGIQMAGVVERGAGNGNAAAAAAAGGAAPGVGKDLSVQEQINRIHQKFKQ